MLLAVRISSYARTWEVWRALKKLELHSANASCNSYASVEEEKPAMRWSFEMRIGGESDKMLFDFIFRVTEGFGIPDRCSQLNQQKHFSTRTSTRVTRQA